MIRRMRRHVNPALVIAVVALFVALGGSSYAALKLPRNSVGSSQIRKDAVNTVKVKNRSLLATDFKKGQLPRGARGPSDGYVGNRQASPLETLTTVATPVAISPQLPAGNYVATGRANIVGFDSASGIVCSFGEDSVQSLSTSSGTIIPLALSSGFKLTEAGRIRMLCQAGSGTGARVAQASVTAVRVENLEIQVTGN